MSAQLQTRAQGKGTGLVSMELGHLREKSWRGEGGETPPPCLDPLPAQGMGSLGTGRLLSPISPSPSCRNLSEPHIPLLPPVPLVLEQLFKAENKADFPIEAHWSRGSSSTELTVTQQDQRPR